MFRFNLFILSLDAGWATWYIHTWSIIVGIAMIFALSFIIYQSVYAFFDPRKKSLKEVQKELDKSDECCGDKINHFAILIPARNESLVIGKLLDSIECQTQKINPCDIYVLVESMDDPTVDICKKRNIEVFVRTNLEGRRRKGYALDECLKSIFQKGIHYDAYFIFDADNVLSPTFIEKMNKTYNEGYDMAMGYRNSLNWNSSIRAVCSALTFTMVNCFSNKRRAKKRINIIVSGTGFYVKGSILESIGGYPFYTLTEDYELSMYAVVNGFKTTYNETAEYFDEQPDDAKTSWNQRERWVRGFFQVRHIYHKAINEGAKEKNYKGACCKDHQGGVTGYILLIVVAFIYLVAMVVGSIILGVHKNPDYIKCLSLVFILLLFIYLCLEFVTFVMLYVNRKKMNMSLGRKAIVILVNPFFLTLWIPIAISALCKKEVTWKVVEHHGTK